MQRHPREISLGGYRVEEFAPGATVGDLVDATHYALGEGGDTSPQETLSDSVPSVAQGELATHQSIERYNFKFQCAHLIDKAFCSGALSALNKDESNFISLSPSLHDQFDGRNSIGAETFAVCVDHVHDHQPGQRAKVDLLVIPDSHGTADFLAASLRDYVMVGTSYRVNVHVKDPALFGVCMTWKYNKTLKGWQDQAKMPGVVDTIHSYNFGLLQERFPGHELHEE